MKHETTMQLLSFRFIYSGGTPVKYHVCMYASRTFLKMAGEADETKRHIFRVLSTSRSYIFKQCVN